MVISQAIKNAVDILKNNTDIESPLLDAQLIMAHILEKDKLFIIVNPMKEISHVQYDQFTENINKRLSNMPVQYIVGRQEFMGLGFEVNESVLIPRPDTEILIEEILKSIVQGKMYEILDIGTGSGCIPISLVKNIKNCLISSVDISEKASEVARKNAKANKVEERIKFYLGSVFEPFENESKKFDIIVSNPPYIPTKIVQTLKSNVKDYEPNIALDGGEDGLDFYREIISQSHKYLKDNSQIFFEIGHDQAQDVKMLLDAADFDDICVVKDLSGLDRVVKARYNIKINREF